ncbi:MAG: type II toxin-antitoxin system HicA family toxin [Candidatus Binatia bacterium]
MHLYPCPKNRNHLSVPGKPSADLAPGTLNSILKQSGLKK